nr:MAG TPA: holin [Caudoviricetes sp.]
MNAMTLQDWALVLAISSILLNILAEIIKHW